MDKDQCLHVCGFPPIDWATITQNTNQPWITPLKYIPGETYKMRGGKRTYIADENGALRRVRE